MAVDVLFTNNQLFSVNLIKNRVRTQESIICSFWRSHVF